jgi:hypothetical protein
MTSEARVYNYLLFIIWLCELYEEDFGGEIVNIGETESDEGV